MRAGGDMRTTSGRVTHAARGAAHAACGDATGSPLFFVVVRGPSVFSIFCLYLIEVAPQEHGLPRTPLSPPLPSSESNSAGTRAASAMDDVTGGIMGDGRDEEGTEMVQIPDDDDITLKPAHSVPLASALSDTGNPPGKPI